jgi:hypothetical protein
MSETLDHVAAALRVCADHMAEEAVQARVESALTQDRATDDPESLFAMAIESAFHRGRAKQAETDTQYLREASEGLSAAGVGRLRPPRRLYSVGEAAATGARGAAATSHPREENHAD